MSNEMFKCLIISALIVLFYRFLNMKMDNKILRLNVKSINKEDGSDIYTQVSIIELIRVVIKKALIKYNN